MLRKLRLRKNNGFLIQNVYLKKEVRDEVDFLHADKH